MSSGEKAGTEGLIDELGLVEADGEIDGLVLLLGETDGDTDGDADELGDTDPLGLTLGLLEELGDVLADGDTD